MEAFEMSKTFRQRSMSLYERKVEIHSLTSRQWQQILTVCAFELLVMTACGITFSFGVFEEHFESIGGPFRTATVAQISLIGTLNSSLTMLGAPLVHLFMERFGLYITVTTSGILFALSGVFSSLGTEVWHFQFTQGILQGFAACLAWIPAVTIGPRISESRRGLTMGILTSGTGLGGMAWALLLRPLLNGIGFRLTFLSTGLLGAILILTAATVLKFSCRFLDETDTAAVPLTLEEEEGKEQGEGTNHDETLSDDNLLRSKAFMAQSLASALQCAAYYTPIYFMSSFARSLDFSETAGANIIALCNLFNVLGKLAIGHVADRFGRLETLIVATAVSALASLGLSVVSGSAIPVNLERCLLVLYAIVYGGSAPVYVGLLPTVLVEQFGLQSFPKVNSLVHMFRGFGSLLGTWVAGSLTATHKGAKLHEPSDFVLAYLFVGSSLTATTGLLLCCRKMGQS